MSLLAIIVIVLLALVLIFFVGGLLGARRRAREHEGRLHERVSAADRALEAARAADRGWDPVLMEDAARVALDQSAPGFSYDALHLVLVDDRPGTDEDRAEFVASSSDRMVRVAVFRRGDQWLAEIIS
jgi:type II secretory pathway pseudopilin PulG